MNPTPDPIAFLQNFSPVTYAPLIVSIGLKIAFMIVFFLYSVFAFLMIRQVRLMGKTVQTTLEPVLTIIAIVHFVVVVTVFLFALLVL